MIKIKITELIAEIKEKLEKEYEQKLEEELQAAEEKIIDNDREEG